MAYYSCIVGGIKYGSTYVVVGIDKEMYGFHKCNLENKTILPQKMSIYVLVQPYQG